MWGERRRRQKGNLLVSVEPQPVIGRPLGLTHAGGREQGCSQVQIALLSFKVQGESVGRLSPPASSSGRADSCFFDAKLMERHRQRVHNPRQDRLASSQGRSAFAGRCGQHRPAPPATTRHRPPRGPGPAPPTGASSVGAQTPAPAGNPAGNRLRPLSALAWEPLGNSVPGQHPQRTQPSGRPGPGGEVQHAELGRAGVARRGGSALLAAAPPGSGAAGADSPRPREVCCGRGAPRVSGRAGGSPAGRVAALPLSAPGF